MAYSLFVAVMRAAVSSVDCFIKQQNMIRALKSIQLVVSIGVIILFLMIYPGVMVVFACMVGCFYVAAAIGSMRDSLPAIWVAFAFSLLTAILSTLGVMRFLTNGFDFLAGNWGQYGGLYFHPYLFVIISFGSIAVVILHLLSWKWMSKRK
jgi:hypothetical protein